MPEVVPHSSQPVGRTPEHVALWACLSLLIALKALLISDLSVYVQFKPHDDNLYVLRALSLLNGQSFGGYNSFTLSKLPGFSLWLAAIRFIGIPYLVAATALQMVSGLYLIWAFRRIHVGLPVCIIAFALYIFNPITFSVEWFRVLREPLETGLLIGLVASMLHILISPRLVWQTVPHLAIMCVIFSFVPLVREDDVLLWGILCCFCVVIFAAYNYRGLDISRPSKALLLACIVCPAGSAIAANYGLRQYVENQYGAPILHDFSEGELPKLMASIRSVKSAKDNRLVMAPQDVLQQLRIVAPSFAPVINLLPKPGAHTESCQLQGVCSELSNGWMLFWIKDGAARAGLTPSLRVAQEYFRTVRLEIERACADGSLICERHGGGLIPPFELRWGRAYVAEVQTLIMMTLRPSIDQAQANPDFSPVPANIVRAYSRVLLTDVPTNLPAVAAVLPAQEATDQFIRWRATVTNAMGFLSAPIIVLGLVSMMARWIAYPHAPLSATFLIGLICVFFVAFRIAILGYVATYFGSFDTRLIFSNHALLELLAPFVVWDFFRTRWLTQRESTLQHV